jgi:hypothetical protein
MQRRWKLGDKALQQPLIETSNAGSLKKLMLMRAQARVCS